MSDIKAFHIPVGVYCVPAAICALTGADLESVVLPALNRAQKAGWLLGPVGGVRTKEFEDALGFMGWRVLRHKQPGRRKLFTWAMMSAGQYKNRRLLVATRDHCLALVNGKIYDTFTPFGFEVVAGGKRHAYHHDAVTYVAILESPK